MKLTKFANFILLGASLALPFVGCKKKPTGLTPLPNYGKTGAPGDLPPGQALPGEGTMKPPGERTAAASSFCCRRLNKRNQLGTLARFVCVELSGVAPAFGVRLSFCRFRLGMMLSVNEMAREQKAAEGQPHSKSWRRL